MFNIPIQAKGAQVLVLKVRPTVSLSKSVLYVLLLVLSFLLLAPRIQAQGWAQNKKGIYSLGIGGVRSVFLPNSYDNRTALGSTGVSFNISGEYVIQRFIGLGWQTGLNFYYGDYYRNRYNPNYGSTFMGIPIGLKLNFHILEAVDASVRDKLDLYVGLNIGGGPAFSASGGEVIGFFSGWAANRYPLLAGQSRSFWRSRFWSNLCQHRRYILIPQ